MARILIVGTSNTFGECKENGSTKIMNHEDCWYQGIYKKHDVTVLAYPGVTSEQQLHYINLFNLLYPTEHFDACIIEGRLPATKNASIPYSYHDYIKSGKLFADEKQIKDYTTLDFLLKDYGDNDYKVFYTDRNKNLFEPFSSASRSDFQNYSSDWNFSRLYEWYSEYVGHPLQIIHTMASNTAACTRALDFCKKVKFVSITGFKVADENTTLFNQEYSYIMPDHFKIKKLWPDIPTYVKEKSGMDLDLCECGHFNSKASKIISDHITDIICKELGI